MFKLNRIFFLSLFLCYFSFLKAEEIVDLPSGSYTLIKELGEGAFGKVYLVEDVNGERFALKTMKVQNFGNDQGNDFMSLLGDAEREYERAQMLDHPNIIKIYEIATEISGSESVSAYLLMEYVPGNPLWNSPKKSMDINQALNSAQGMINALRHGLNRGLVFFDLHAANIVISNEGDSMMVDLASFFTYPELIELFGAWDDLESNPTSEKSLTSFESVKHRDINEMKRLFRNEHKEIQSRLKKHFSGKDFSRKAKSAPNASNQITWVLNSIYFESIATLCSEFLSLSTLRLDEKLELRAEIMKLSWQLSYEAEEGIFLPLDIYLDRLTNVLHTPLAEHHPQTVINPSPHLSLKLL